MNRCMRLIQRSDDETRGCKTFKHFGYLFLNLYLLTAEGKKASDVASRGG